MRNNKGQFIKGLVPWNKGVNNVKCKCVNCKKFFYPTDFVKRMYCSRECKINHYIPYNKGQKKKFKCLQCHDIFIPRSHGKEYKFCSKKCNGKYFCKEKNNKWKGGITEVNHKIRTSKEYLKWRIGVLQRDFFKCISCGYRSKGNNTRDIVVDHIKPFSLYPQLRLNIDNGRTLCRKCDSILGWNFSKESRKHGSAAI